MGKESDYSTREVCRSNRKKPTEAEAKLWEQLRNRKLDGIKFRRQFPIEGFILDFYCPSLKIGIELDGEIHRKSSQHQYDQDRTIVLNESGVTVLRFWNSEVLNANSIVIERIRNSIRNQK